MGRWTSQKPLLLATFLLGCGSNRDAAARLLESTCHRYASATSYQDVGTVDEVYPPRPRPPFAAGDVIPDRTVHARFRTAFVRPNSLRFDFQSRQPVADGLKNFVLWASDSSAHIWGIDVPVATARGGLEALAGVTSMASDIVPQLLLGDQTICRPHAVVAMVAAQEVFGTPCNVVVVDLDWGPGRTKRLDLCIDSSYTLRGWRTRNPDGEHEVVSASYEPQFDVPLPAEVFDFVPPPRRTNQEPGTRAP